MPNLTLARQQASRASELKAWLTEFDQMISAVIHWIGDEPLEPRFEALQRDARETLASFDEAAALAFDAIEPDRELEQRWSGQTRGNRSRIAWYSTQYHKLFSQVHRRLRGPVDFRV